MASYNANRFSPFVKEQVTALEKQGCKVEWFGITKKGLLGYIKELPRLRRKINECAPNVIHAHYGLSCLLANLATRRVPVVSTYHGSDINDRRVLPFSKRAMNLSAWNIFVSQRTLDIAKPKKRYELLPCGVDLSETQLIPREDARKQLDWKKSDVKVLFAGAFDNPVKDSQLAKRVIEDMNLVIPNLELVELKGYTRMEVNTLMCAANCLLLTSKTEGSPQVIKEAMACGCPIVSVDVGDVKERIDGIDGCYVAKTREPKEIAELIEKALSFEGRTVGRERIVESGLDNRMVAQRLVMIYQEVVKKTHPK